MTKKHTIEDVDDITNEIMDYIREVFKLKEDSDKDDEVYTFIHNHIKKFIFSK